MTEPRKGRFRTEQPGITSLHCFSAGPHYDPNRVSFGPVVGVDEHLVAPGAGFDWHGHRGVHIVSWVLEGALRHEDSNGEVRSVTPGVLFVQSTGDGIRHTETNSSDSAPLRFVQITIVGDDRPGLRLVEPPATVAGVRVDITPYSAIADGRAFVLALGPELLVLQFDH